MLPLFAAGIALGACTADGGPEPPAPFLADLKLQPATADEVTVCHGYNCRYKSRIRITADDISELKAIFARMPETPAGEREGMSLAVGWLETKAGALVGTANDEGGVLDNDSIGDPSKQDCVDEAATTTGYLMMLSLNGLITRHNVVKPRVRGIFIDGRWQHFTAVVRERDSNSEFAIDSWFRPNGQRAVVMTINDWLNDYAGVESKQLPGEG